MAEGHCMKLSLYTWLGLALCLPVIASATTPSHSGKERGSALVQETVSVAQLQQTLKEVESKPDAEAARELSELKLTERLSSPKLALWMNELHGPKARTALVALADSSAFLSLPAAEMPVATAPDLDEQRRIIGQAVLYLTETIPRLPNFYATRTTARFEDMRDNPEMTGSSILTGQPLHEVGNSSVTVIYRNGSEVISPVASKGRPKYVEEKGLITKGTFGPILSTVMVDASHGVMTFNHWEQGATDNDAVFAFTVPKEKSHYDVAMRSPSAQSQSYELQQTSAYHGEVAIDPATGTILRIALQADLELGLSILRADIMVEYGSVDIGGKPYTCPVRSVSVSTGRAVIVMRDPREDRTALGPEITRLNDVSFGDYHVFRAEVRIVSGDPAPTEHK
jgi:hypothetical protein